MYASVPATATERAEPRPVSWSIVLLAESAGELVDGITVAGMAAGLRERLVDAGMAG